MHSRTHSGGQAVRQSMKKFPLLLDKKKRQKGNIVNIFGTSFL